MILHAKGFLHIGHRGAKAHETENTLEGFRKAVELGANAIEFDVRRTRDGKLAVIHDQSLKRVFGKDVRVGEASMSQLKAISHGRIPTLRQALRFIGRKVSKVLIELKEPGCEQAVIDAVRKVGLQERVIIISFLAGVLRTIRHLAPDVETGFIYVRHGRPIARALSLGASYILPFHKHVCLGEIERAHEKGLKVILWTINSRRIAERWRAGGVDGIASDRPEILVEP